MPPLPSDVMASTRGERLKIARSRFFDSARQAAAALDVSPATYGAHERAESPNGRDYGPEEAKKYARRFKVRAEWLLMGTGEGPSDVPQPVFEAEVNDGPHPKVVKVKGYVGAGAQAHFYAVSQGDLDEVPAPDDATPDTVAVEIRGDSLGALFDRWIVYYDDVRRPVTADLNGKLCVVGLADDRILIKKLRQQNGHWRLLSEREDPIDNAEIEWAARVKAMVPR